MVLSQLRPQERGFHEKVEMGAKQYEFPLNLKNRLAISQTVF